MDSKVVRRELRELTAAEREAYFGAMFTLAYWMKYSVWHQVLELKEAKAGGHPASPLASSRTCGVWWTGLWRFWPSRQTTPIR